ncbi:glutamine--tRNA ligase-like protein, partial [Tanacetum coccineum]
VYSEDKTSVVEIHAEYDPDNKTKPEASQRGSSLGCMVRLTLKLIVQTLVKQIAIKSENPGELDNWLDDLNPESKVVIPCYFVVDKDSTPEKLIFNRTVALTDTYKGGSK